MTRPLIIFDVDGTLIDSQDLIVAAMTRALTQHGHPVPGRAAILSVVGLSLNEAMAQLLPGLSGADYDALSATYRDGFIRQRREAGGEAIAPLYPGARATLEALKSRGMGLGIATGKAMRGVDHMLDTHALRGIFDTIQTADGHPSKPHPSMILSAMEEVGTPPARTVIIGDTAFDMAMGRAAGVRTIGVAWGYHPVERLDQADRVIAGFDALAATLDELLEATA